MYDNDGLILVILFILVFILAFLCGGNSALKFSQREAVKAGVGYYTADEDGKSEFAFITPCTNCIAK